MSVSSAYRKLANSQKSAKGAPLYSLLVNRPLGRVFAAIAYPLGMTPNQVTMVSALFTFSAIGVLAAAPPGVLTYVGVSIGLVLGYALDSADGQLARLRGGGSLSGEWLDHVIDSVKVASLHLAVAVMAFRCFEAPKTWLLVPLAFSAISVIHFFGMLLTELLTRNNAEWKKLVSGGGLLKSAAKLPTDYGVLCLTFVLVPWETAFIVVYTLLAIANAAYTVLVSVAWFRRIRKFD